MRCNVTKCNTRQGRTRRGRARRGKARQGKAGQGKTRILDALNNYDGPVVEIHISQVHKREEFRHHSYISYRADAVIAGLGIEGYAAAVRYICNL